MLERLPLFLVPLGSHHVDLHKEPQQTHTHKHTNTHTHTHTHTHHHTNMHTHTQGAALMSFQFPHDLQYNLGRAGDL